MEQIIDIGEYGDRVRLEGGRIAIHRADGTQAFVPLGDVAVMMFSEPGLSVSMAVLAELAKNGGTAVACDRTHTPVGIFQPLAAHSRATAVLLGQIAARPVLRARLWLRIGGAGAVLRRAQHGAGDQPPWPDESALSCLRSDGAVPSGGGRRRA